MRVLDSHLHLWDPSVLSYEWLDGSLAAPFGPEAFAAARIGVDESSVFVQAECVEEEFLDEVRWVDSIADAVGVRGIVAGARLDRGDATLAQLDALAAHHRVVGVRHLLQGEPDGLAATPAFLIGARAVAARGWTFDACIRSRQLEEVTALAAAMPELRIVLDHLGKPEVGTATRPAEPSEHWVRELGALAQHPQVFCKLSGLPAEAGGDWSAAQIEPFLDAAAAAFGPDRLMWGSDWPVSAIGFAEHGDPSAPAGGSDPYQPTARMRWAGFVASWAEARGLDVDAILWRNAAGFYGL